MEITSAVVYKPQLQTALEKKTADVFCKNLKKRSGVSLLQSKTSGKISIEFYKEDSCSEEVKALFDGITVPGKEGFRIRVIDNPDGSGRIVVLGKDERGEFYGMARLLRKAIVKKGSIRCGDISWATGTKTIPTVHGQKRNSRRISRIWRCSEQTPSSCFRRRRMTVCIPHFSRKIRWS